MQIRINPIHRRTKSTQPMNAATVCLEAQSMLHQISLPIDPRDTIKARRERELQARELQHEFGLTDAEARHDAVDAA